MELDEEVQGIWEELWKINKILIGECSNAQGGVFRVGSLFPISSWHFISTRGWLYLEGGGDPCFEGMHMGEGKKSVKEVKDLLEEIETVI